MAILGHSTVDLLSCTQMVSIRLSVLVWTDCRPYRTVYQSKIGLAYYWWAVRFRASSWTVRVAGHREVSSVVLSVFLVRTEREIRKLVNQIKANLNSVCSLIVSLDARFSSNDFRTSKCSKIQDLRSFFILRLVQKCVCVFKHNKVL